MADTIINNDGTIILENGVKIRTKAVSSAVLRGVLGQLKEPKVPTFKLDDGSDEENPNDPDYREAMDTFAMAVIGGASRAWVQLGTEVLAWPAGFPTWDSDEWVEEFESVGIAFHRNAQETAPDGVIDISTERRRKFQWKSMVVLNGIDLAKVWPQVMRKNGTQEAEVLAAMKWFQARKERTGPAESAAESGTENGANIVQLNAGDGAAVRGNEGSSERTDTVEQVVPAPARF